MAKMKCEYRWCRNKGKKQVFADENKIYEVRFLCDKHIEEEMEM